MPRDRYDRDERDDDDDRPRRRRDDDDDRPRRSRRYRDDDDFDRPPPRKSSGGKIALLVVGILVVVLVVCGGIAYLALMPAIQRVRDASARMAAQNNLKQSSLGQWNYETTTQSLSRPFLDTDERGTQITPPANPSDRLSWRVGLLPYLGEADAAAAYSRFNIREPWNSSTNAPLKDTPIKAYRHPLDVQEKGEPVTRIRCFYDNGALFESKPHARVSFTSITDGAANTIMYVESADKVSWTPFNDFRYEPNAPPPPLGHPNTPGGFNVVMADGSVRFVRNTTSPQAIKAAITRAGGEISQLD